MHDKKKRDDYKRNRRSRIKTTFYSRILSVETNYKGIEYYKFAYLPVTMSVTKLNSLPGCLILLHLRPSPSILLPIPPTNNICNSDCETNGVVNLTLFMSLS